MKENQNLLAKGSLEIKGVNKGMNDAQVKFMDDIMVYIILKFFKFSIFANVYY